MSSMRVQSRLAAWPGPLRQDLTWPGVPRGKAEPSGLPVSLPELRTDLQASCYPYIKLVSVNPARTRVRRYSRGREPPNVRLGVLACAFCLLPFLGSGEVIFFFLSCRHGRYPLCLNSFPLDSWQCAAGCLAQDGHRGGVRSQPAAGCRLNLAVTLF